MGGTAPADGRERAYWGELVTAALLGAERRTPPGGSITALLDEAAVQTVQRRAALRPASAQPRDFPEAAPDDPRAPLPEAAARRLALLLADRGAGSGTGSTGGRRSTRPDLAELLPQWLSAACARGYRPPAAQLPALLDAARARTDLRPGTLEFAGPRGLWLARLNPDWKFALRSAARQHAVATTATKPDDEQGTGAEAAPAGAVSGAVSSAAGQLWEEGLFAERVSVLTALRRHDPAAGRALLVSTWATERAEDRLMFLDTLREGLGPEDEPFLEGALADRSCTVRSTAAELLSGLPDSALAARMAARSRACVTLDAAGAGGVTPDGSLPEDAAPIRSLPEDTVSEGTAPNGSLPADAVPDGSAGDPCIAVAAPASCDAAMQRDGVVPKPPSGRGERAWWLGQLVEATPLSVWKEQFGGRGAAEVVALPVRDGWQRELHAAWCRAAVRQRDAEWARALIGPPTDPLTEGPGDPAKLLTVLPEGERAAWAARFIAAHGLSEAFRILGVCAVPWAGELGRSVIDALEIARDAGSYPWSFSGVMGLAERCLDPADAERLTPLAAIPDEPEGGSPGAGAYWAEAFQRLVGTLRLRATMLAELDGPAEITEGPPGPEGPGGQERPDAHG
ncbi:DUF5691 domain-containing protein [Streptomyces sp. ODS28]|uniref:DUF5691 domain-containing protein n=1 Tax=Streptomyces sp. ODS28 TaxID=3136688 RepID=UPI0031E6CE13